MLKEFYEKKDIFVTGGSGVVGKALIEKLLRSCNVGKIYVLLRPKKNLSIEERLEELKKKMIFRQLKLKKPDEMDKKLKAIPGDAAMPFLGITAEYQKVLENVSIVFHCAATVRFDAPLRDALKLNVGGTLEMLKFSETLKKLDVVMHVSTFFSNPYLKRVEDKVYQSPMDWQFCLSLLERNDVTDEVLNTLTRKLIIGFPNTYCFTKNLAESLVNDHRHKLPVAIFRPSVVSCTVEEPEPGFAPSLMGFTGLFAAVGAGILKTIYINKDLRLDMSPQDIAVKSLCYYAFKAASLYRNKEKIYHIPVFTTSSCTHTNYAFVEYVNIMQDYGFWHDAAFEKSLLTPYVYCTDNIFVYWVLFTLLQLIPSLLVDLALILWRRKPVLMAVQRKMFSTLKVVEPFMFNNYESQGVTLVSEMLDNMKDTDFNMDVTKSGDSFYNTVELCQPIAYSVREHLFKEDPKTLPKSRKILKIKMLIYKIVKFLLAFKVYERVWDYIAYIYAEKLPGNKHSTFIKCDNFY